VVSGPYRVRGYIRKKYSGKMVDRVGPWKNQNYIYDSLTFSVNPKKVLPSKIRSDYLESDLTSGQIAERLGIAKSTVLRRLHAAGVLRQARRGRSPTNYRFKGSTPYGKRVVNGKLVVHPAEITVARLIIELRERRGFSWAEMKAAVDEKGLTTRRGTPWSISLIRHVYKTWRSKL
jgi:DNA-binding transcriptional MerR regulator